MKKHSAQATEKPANCRRIISSLAAAAVLSLLIPWLDTALKTYTAQSFSAFQLATGNPMLAIIGRLALPLLFGIVLAASLVSLYRVKDKLACGIALALSAVSFALFVMGILGLVRIAPFVDPSAYFWAAIALCAYLYTFIYLCVKKN